MRMKKYRFVILLLPLFITKTENLSYGVANTPPMGWSSWMVFQCNTFCSNQDGNQMCYSEHSIQQIANVMSEEFLQAGYEYIILDDCWQNQYRENYHQLVADYYRFPNGIKGLAEYVHKKGLKLGIFSDLGPQTGKEYPGSQGFYEYDARTFVNWGVDYVKMSACTDPPNNLNHDYREFGSYLARSPRQIVYAVSWPVYRTYNHYPVDYKEVRSVAHTWRFYDDVDANWETLLNIMDYYASEQATLANVAGHFAGRSGWNDPDVLLVGHPGLTYNQAKVQMAVWCIMAAPLIISSDIRNLEYRYKAILLNRDAIAIDQDKLGLPGYRLPTDNNIDIWVREIDPYINGHYSYAIAFVNRHKTGPPISVTTTLGALKMNNVNGYYVKEVFSEGSSGRGTLTLPTTPLTFLVEPASVVFYKTEVSQESIENSPRIIINDIPEIIRHRY